MASEIVKDIDKKFCRCPICLDQLKDPKLLPCLHRFCKCCLAEMIRENRIIIACPVCREECVVPKEGLDGFRTDFYMKSIIEYIQLQKTLHDEQAEECYGCSKTLRVSAYCFKCNGFLCKTCHQCHMTSKITKEHRPHTLAVEDVTSESLSFDKIATLKAAPRCHTHYEKVSELCCKTCSNIPICVACTYGNHKSHEIYEVTALAHENRQKLEQKLSEVYTFEEGILQMPEKLDKIKSDLNVAVSEKLKSTQSDYLKIEKCTREKLQFLEIKSKLSRNEKEFALNKELKLIERKMESEIQKIKEKYDKRCEEKRRKVSDEVQIIQRQYHEEASRLQERLAAFELEYKEAKSSLEKQRHGNLQKLQEVSSHFENTSKRLKNLKETASCVLKTKNDWTVVQCIPDIFEACNPLIVDMQKQLPDLQTLIQIEQKPLSFADLDYQAHICQSSVVDIVGMTGIEWDICDIAVSQSGDIVITGNAADHESHITVVNERGNVNRQWIMENLSGISTEPDRFCDFLSEDTIATTCDPNELGIFNIRDGSYAKTNISDVTSEWPEERGVTCIATDPATKQIIVGSWEGSLVCVFDDRLNLLNTLTLPEPMTGATDMFFNKEKSVVVCCTEAKTAIVMTMIGPLCEKIFEFSQPFAGLGHWKPLSMCKDKTGFIFILWSCLDVEIGQHVIAKYGLDGGQVVAVQLVDNNIANITTSMLGNREILLATTFPTRKMYQYDLAPKT